MKISDAVFDAVAVIGFFVIVALFVKAGMQGSGQ